MCIIHEKASQQVPSDHVDSTSRTELLHRSSFLAMVTMTRLGKQLNHTKRVNQVF